MVFLTVLAVLSLSVLMPVQAKSALQPICTISLAQWESPSRTQVLMSDPALRTLIKTWEAQPGSRLQIDYPAGEQGDLWAHRMRTWLVAFGVPKKAMRLEAGGTRNDLALSLLLPQGGGA